MSVAEGVPVRSPNPREGIHGSPRIARITRISTERVCGDLRGLRAIWLAAVHRWLFCGAKIRKSEKNQNKKSYSMVCVLIQE